MIMENNLNVYGENDIARAKEMGTVFVDFHIPRYEELPNIPLYLDQVIGILNDTLEPFIEYGEDKMISGAMVNNYVKHKVIVAPVKKRYSKHQLCDLFVLSIMKKVFSIPEVSALNAMRDEAGELAAGYNHFCDELELALKLKFGNEAAIEGIRGKSDWETIDMSRAMALAFANKLFVQKIIWTRMKDRSDKIKEGTDGKNAESGKKKKEEKI